MAPPPPAPPPRVKMIKKWLQTWSNVPGRIEGVKIILSLKKKKKITALLASNRKARPGAVGICYIGHLLLLRVCLFPPCLSTVALVFCFVFQQTLMLLEGYGMDATGKAGPCSLRWDLEVINQALQTSPGSSLDNGWSAINIQILPEC